MYVCVVECVYMLMLCVECVYMLMLCVEYVYMYVTCMCVFLCCVCQNSKLQAARKIHNNRNL